MLRSVHLGMGVGLLLVAIVQIWVTGSRGGEDRKGSDLGAERNGSDKPNWLRRSDRLLSSKSARVVYCPPGRIVRDGAGGFRARDAELNDVLAFLAAKQGWRYCPRADLRGAERNVSGHFREIDAGELMEVLLARNDMRPYAWKGTLYALTPEQYASTQPIEVRYKFRQLGPSRMELAEELIRKSGYKGPWTYESSTRTVVLFGLPMQVDDAVALLKWFDRSQEGLEDPGR